MMLQIALKVGASGCGAEYQLATMALRIKTCVVHSRHEGKSMMPWSGGRHIIGDVELARLDLVKKIV